MNKTLFCAVILVCSCLALSAHANEEDPVPVDDSKPIDAKKSQIEWTPLEIAGAALLFEGAMALNAKMAASNPHVYGYAGLLLFPLGSDNRMSEASFWALMVGAESLAIYNIRIDEEKMTKNEIFRANMIGWHALMLVGGITGYFAGDFSKDKKVSLNYLPEPQGGKLLLSFRF